MQALASAARTVLVVTGASSFGKEIKDNRLEFIRNTKWQEGMASSIRCGLNFLLERDPHLANVLFMVCDQPFVSAALLNDLITTRNKTGKLIVASEYQSVKGIPAIFAKDLFPALLLLQGDTGAKKLIAQYAHETAVIPFPGGEIDIDTAADYAHLRQIQQKPID